MVSPNALRIGLRNKEDTIACRPALNSPAALRKEILASRRLVTGLATAWTSQAMGQNDEEFISEKVCVTENR